MSKFNEWLKRGVGDDEQEGQSQPFNNVELRKTKTEAFLSSKPYSNVVIYTPRTNLDIQNLIDFLKRKEAAIVNINQVDANTAQRMLDFISGAVYALNGKINNISAKIYLLTPEGVNITIPEID